MRRFIYYLLIVTLIIPVFGFTGPSNVGAEVSYNKTKNDIVIKKSNTEYAEAFELNSIHYYYEDTDRYTIVITRAKNGGQSVAFKDKTSKNDEIYYHVSGESINNNNESSILTDKDIHLVSLNIIDTNRLEEVKNSVLNNEITLNKYSIDEFADVTHLDENEASMANSSRIYQGLREVFGEPFTFRHLQSLTERGYTGHLYFHKTYGAHPKTTLLYKVSTAIGIISAFYNVPTSGLLRIALWAAAGVEGYKLASATNFTDWNTTHYLQKEVKVGSVYPYRSFYDRHYDGVTGSRGSAVFGPLKRSYQSNDYNSNTTILRKGIDNYIRFHR